MTQVNGKRNYKHAYKCVVPDDEVEWAKNWVWEQMVKEPSYLPGIPLNSEVGAHRRYGLAKG